MSSEVRWRYAQGRDRTGAFFLQAQPESYFCPDILRWEVLGRADTLRGCLVLAFFWLLRLWRVKRA